MYRIMFCTLFTLVLVASSASAGPPNACDSVGQLTKWAIQDLEGWDQGQHSSDPSGDGHGQGTADEPRVGLPNILGKGNLTATLELLVALLNPPCE